MQKYRVVKTNVECLYDNLTEDEANYALANLVDLGNFGCSIIWAISPLDSATTL